MITIENKLDIFYKLVFKKEEENSKRILEDIDNRNKKILEDKAEELKKMQEEIIKKRERLAQAQKNEKLSVAKEDSREKILVKRKVILEDLIDLVKERASEFVQTKEYKKYMLDRIKDVLLELKEKDIRISLIELDIISIKEDLIIMSKLLDKNIEFIQLSSNEIGGFVITDKDKTYNLDGSFKTIIEENRYKIGKELNIILEKSGELNE